MNRYKIIIFAITLIIFLSQNIFSKTIVTSIYPLYSIIKEVVPKNYNIIYAIPIGANPHTFSPSPKKVIEIKKGDIFIGISKEFDGWIEKFLDDKCNICYLIKKNNINPHIWLSPVIMYNKINLINDAICKIDKKSCYIIKDNTLNYKKNLLALYNRLKLKIKKLNHKNIIQYHPAWNYFAKDFGLKIVGTLSKEHGVNVSIKKYLELINKSKKYNVKLVITGFKSNNNIIKKFSKSIGAKIVYLNLFGNLNYNYFQLIEENIKTLLHAENIIQFPKQS